MVLAEIESDPDFGKRLADAIRSIHMMPGRVDVRAGCHVNAASVIEAHHADETTVVAVGMCNFASVLGSVYGAGRHHEEADRIRLSEDARRRIGLQSRKEKLKPGEAQVVSNYEGSSWPTKRRRKKLAE
jgi:hypothetical protein